MKETSNEARIRSSCLSYIFVPRYSSLSSRHYLPLIPDGLEPSFSGCRPGVVAAGPRDRFLQHSCRNGE
jgi:hypothetical protein